MTRCDSHASTSPSASIGSARGAPSGVLECAGKCAWRYARLALCRTSLTISIDWDVDRVRATSEKRTRAHNNWQLHFLAHELAKGTAELICLHRLSQLDDKTYRRVTTITDYIHLEPWMLQTGGGLWRRSLIARPEGCPVSRVLLNFARLPAVTLESVLQPVIEQTEEARVRPAHAAQ